MWAPIMVRMLDVLWWLVEKWAENEATKRKWKEAIEESRAQYRKGDVYNAPQMKRDYDDLQKDLKEGKYKL